jgi:hypothetical protein
MQRKDLVSISSGSILLVVPEGNSHRTAASEFLADQHQANQAFFFNDEEETLKINTVRELLRHTSFARAKSEPQTIIVCAAQNATLPAQNALLKIVEEPPAYTQILLTVTPGHQLLPTLVSRCREIIWSASDELADQDEVSLQAQDELNKKINKLGEFLKNPTSYSYSALILLAEELADLETAKQALRATLSGQAPNQPHPSSPQITQQLLIALDSLEKNGNVRLVLEHLFFTIKQL